MVRKGRTRQAGALEGFDIGFADGVAFRPDDVGVPGFGDLAQAALLEGPADFVEAVDGDDLFGGGVDDGDGGVVAAASPVDAGDVAVIGLGIGRAGSTAAFKPRKTWPASSLNCAMVFGLPDVIRGLAADAFQFFHFDFEVFGGVAVAGVPVGFVGVVADVEEVAEPVGGRRACSGKRRCRGWWRAWGGRFPARCSGGMKAASSKTTRSRPSPRRRSG